jgi:hypothetical protein
MKYIKNLSLPRSLYRCFAAILFSLAFLCCAVLIPVKWGNHSKHHCDIKVCVSNTGIHTPSVLYVKGYQIIPNYLEVKCIKITQTDYLQLINFIESSFQLDANGRQIRLGNGHTDNAGFYAAKGSYSILKNCNSWTAEGLRKADINTPLWSGLSSAIMFHLKSNCK